MIATILLRHYKNYSNMKFVPICDSVNYRYSVYVGNNGVGKSAILEALDVELNGRFWNITFNMKKSEAFICPLFLIEKSKIPTSKRGLFSVVSDFFWSADETVNANIKSNKELQEFIRYKNTLKGKYINTHYLVLIGTCYDDLKGAFCATFQSAILTEIKNILIIESPSESLLDVKK